MQNVNEKGTKQNKISTLNSTGIAFKEFGENEVTIPKEHPLQETKKPKNPKNNLIQRIIRITYEDAFLPMHINFFFNKLKQAISCKSFGQDFNFDFNQAIQPDFPLARFKFTFLPTFKECRQHLLFGCLDVQQVRSFLLSIIFSCTNCSSDSKRNYSFHEIPESKIF